jgi:predicted dehydrogenase
VNLAFIGASHWHLPLYLEPALDAPGARVVGISDPDPGFVATWSDKLGCAGDVDFRALCHKTKPDFVFALGRHADMVEEARFLLGEGIPFAIEKPCGLNERDVAGLAALEARSGGFSAVPLVFRNGDFIARPRYGRRGHPIHDVPLYRRLCGPVSAGQLPLDARSRHRGRRLHDQS